MKKILTIESRVAYGFVGCNIADFVIQLQGVDVISIPTVMLSGQADNKILTGIKIPLTLFWN